MTKKQAKKPRVLYVLENRCGIVTGGMSDKAEAESLAKRWNECDHDKLNYRVVRFVEDTGTRKR